MLLGLSRLQSLLRCGVENAGGIDQAGVGVKLQTETWEVKSLDVKIALERDGLVGKSTPR